MPLGSRTGRELRHLVAAWLALALALVVVRGRADPPNLNDLSSYSPYEQKTVSIGLEQTGATLESDPEGKIIEGVDFVTLEVIEKRDPAPGFLNWFHVTTKPHFVARELLFHVGDRYERRIVEESARNLRALPQFTIVLVLPVRGSAPDRVRMLVVTKDLWSLRLSTEYRFTNGTFELLQVQLTEINLLGTHHQAAANFVYDPDTVSFGGALIVPRVWDSRLRFFGDVNAIVNHHTGAAEGSYGQFTYGQPLFSLASEWAYGARIAWRTDIRRRYIGPQVSVFDAERHQCALARDPGTGALRSGIPCKYSRDVQVGSISATRSFGRDVKHNVGVSLEANRRVYRTDDLNDYEPAVAEDFRQRFPPVSDTRIGPALRYQTFSARYTRVLDIERLGLQEEYQVGHNLLIKVSPAFAPLRESRAVVGIFAGASYTFALGDGLLRFYAESSTDVEPSGAIPDGSLDLGTRVVSPRQFFGRLVLDARLLHRYANSLNGGDTLGSDTRLRGYPTGAFFGKDLVVANLELRSRPVEILSCQIAGVAFLDVGDAFDGFDALDVKRSAGFGVRGMFPQLNRIVFRADWGFPLSPSEQYQKKGGLPGELSITFGQAFGVPSVPVSQAVDQ